MVGGGIVAGGFVVGRTGETGDPGSCKPGSPPDNTAALSECDVTRIFSKKKKKREIEPERAPTPPQAPLPATSSRSSQVTGW